MSAERARTILKRAGYASGGDTTDKIQRIADLQADRAASDRGEMAAGSASRSFSSMLEGKAKGGRT